MGRPSSGGIGQDQGRTLLSTHLISLWSWSSYDYHPAVWCESGRTRSLATTSRRNRQWENCGHGIKVTHGRRVSIFQYWERMPGSNVRPWEIRVLSTWEAYLEWDWPLTSWTGQKKHRRSSCTTANTSLAMPEIWHWSKLLARRKHPCCWCPVTRMSEEGRTYPCE